MKSTIAIFKKGVSKITVFLFIFLVSTKFCHSQISGVKSIPGDYASLSSAVSALNSQGVGAGGVTFNVAAGFIENTSGLVINASGTSNAPIIFKKAGAGNNPIVRNAASGTASSSLGAPGSAVIIINGADYITFDGIDVSAPATSFSYGYHVRKASSSDGCKNVTIRNCKVKMGRGTGSSFVVGIFISNLTSSSPSYDTQGITLTSPEGRHENILLIADTIENVHTGILVRGFNHKSAPYDWYDQNCIIGTKDSGNVVRNFASNYVSIFDTASAIRLFAQNNASIQGNTIDNIASGGVVTSASLAGITETIGVLSNIVITNNIISLTTGSSNSGHSYYGISTIGATGNVDIDSNRISMQSASGTRTGKIYFINQKALNNNSTVNIRLNTFASQYTSEAGSVYLMNAGAYGNTVYNVAFNRVDSLTFMTGEFYGFFDAGSNNFTGIHNFSNNDISRINLNTETGYTTTFYGCYISSSGRMSVLNNLFSNINSQADGSTSAIYGYTSVQGLIHQNHIFNITSGGKLHGIVLSGNKINVFKNKVYNLVSTSVLGSAVTFELAQVAGIFIINSGSDLTINNNIIGDLKAPFSGYRNSVCGVSIQTGSAKFYYNTIYLNANSTGNNFGTACLFYWGGGMPPEGSNNVLINTSSSNGLGVTAVTMNGKFIPPSNNNLLYVGLPGASNYLHYQATGGTSYKTLSDYKAGLSPAETMAISEMPHFLSTIGSSPYYLHIDTSFATGVRKGGKPIAGIDEDFDGDIRDTISPDIGADEIPFALCPVNSWIGAVNTAWENPGNWSCGIIPNASTNVVIGTGYTVIIHSNAIVNTLAIGSGSNLMLTAGYNLTVLH